MDIGIEVSGSGDLCRGERDQERRREREQEIEIGKIVREG